MYLGSPVLNLDAKGRLMIPAKHRDVLTELCNGQLYLTRCAEDCLLLLPKDVFHTLEAQILQWPATMNALRRLYLSNAIEVEWDNAGRILIPPEMRVKAHLEKEVALKWNGTHYQLWNPSLADALEEEAKSKAEAQTYLQQLVI